MGNPSGPTSLYILTTTTKSTKVDPISPTSPPQMSLKVVKGLTNILKTRIPRNLLSISSFSSSYTPPSSLRTSFTSDLATILPNELIITNQYVLERHGTDESFHAPSPPAAVLRPKTERQVQDIVKLCSKHGVPLVPFGAGTSLEVSAVNPALCYKP